jgi:L-ascorbate metabolism protein UlaG (beta-lactamase superfamily)
MIEPVLRDNAFLADVAAAGAGSAGTDRFHLWWLGQSGFLLHWRGRHLLLDPYLSDSLTRKYETTDKPHVRMTARVVDPARLDFVAVVVSSHNHTDHLDAETIGPLLRANPELQLVGPEANREFIAGRLGIDAGAIAGVDHGRAVTAAGFRLTGVAAAHETVERDEQGRCRFLGYLVRFGRWTLYHSGDTMLYDGLAEHIRDLAAGRPIDVALLPINGRAPERRVAGNLDGPEAARLAREIGAALAIPMHYEMFTFNTASPEPFVAGAERIGQSARVLRCGERWSSDEIPRAGPEPT